MHMLELNDEIDELQVRPDYYRMEFQTQSENSIGTFTFNEEVILYNMSEDEELMSIASKALQTETPQDLQTEEESPMISEVVQKIFRLYKDPGFIERVSEVHGRVLDWNKPEGKLIVGDLTNLDPDREDENKDVTENKFDVVMIVGQESGAQYVSIKAEMMEAPFSDNEVIQKEFDAIKIIDVADDNPFGFV